MSIKTIFLMGLVWCTSLLNLSGQDYRGGNYRLWYDKPAKSWMNEALPIGNGELGAMFFGGIDQERIQFNEKTLWTGSPTKRGAYQNFGDLYLNFNHGTDTCLYMRELDLSNAVGFVRYRVGNTTYEREYLSSYPDKVIAIRLTAVNREKQITFSAYIKNAHEGVQTTQGNSSSIQGKLDLLHYYAGLRIVPEGGELRQEGDTIYVQDANSATIYLTGGTNYDITKPNYTAFAEQGDEAILSELSKRYEERLDKASQKGYNAIRNAHTRDYLKLYSRVGIYLGKGESKLPTNQLVARNVPDNYLDALYYQYGRYLLIASSRGMSLPNNLQGIWNDSNTPPWESDIHTNINIQMNYWLAEATGLAECHLPFLNFIKLESQRKGGGWQAVAQNEGLRGWTLHTQSNIFGQTDWNINRPTNAWYCMHLWQHYLYTQDLDYLRTDAYPTMQSACEYWFDRLRRDDKGKWIAPQEWSPEHGPWEDGIAYAQQLITELFSNTLEASKALGEEQTPFATKLASYYQDLDRGIHIGSWGQIREWKQTEDNPKDEHRHLSHLIALYPGAALALANNPDWTVAARTSLTARGDQGTGWSRAWKISLWARLRDGNHAYKLLRAALNPTMHTSLSMSVKDGGVYDNLFDAHPPFQIDGNFGATAGITEMLVQSPTDVIEILPALPDQWRKEGSISGIRTSGGFIVSVSWKEGKVDQLKIESDKARTCAIRIPSSEGYEVANRYREPLGIQPDTEGIFRFVVEPGKDYIITKNLWQKGKKYHPKKQRIKSASTKTN